MQDLRNTSYLRRDTQVFGVQICQGLYALLYSMDKVKPEPTLALWSESYKVENVLGAKEYLFNICTAASVMLLSQRIDRPI